MKMRVNEYCLSRVPSIAILVLWLMASMGCGSHYVRPETRSIAVSDFRCESDAMGRQAADIMRLILIDKGYNVIPDAYDIQDESDGIYTSDQRHSANMIVTGEITTFKCEADDKINTRVSRLAGVYSSRVTTLSVVEKKRCEVGLKIRFVDVGSGKTLWSADVVDKPQGSKNLTPYLVLRNIMYRLGTHIPRGL